MIKKNAKELHDEHRRWSSVLKEIEDELIIMAKHSESNFKHDVGSLLKSCVNLQKSIKKHESSIALAFKSCGIQEYNDIFDDHQKTRQAVDNIKFRFNNLRILLSKHHKFKKTS